MRHRIPQITIEVIRRPNAGGVRVEDVVSAVTMIPALGEFIYATDTVFRDDGYGRSSAENRHGAIGQADFLVALDQLKSGAPNIDTVSLVVSWHGTDLRCGDCQIKPKVEFGASKITTHTLSLSEQLRVSKSCTRKSERGDGAGP